MREPWIGSFARRIVAPICGGFAREAFTRRSFIRASRCDKETRVRYLPAMTHIDSEHAN
jgi:hypothetical protein